MGFQGQIEPPLPSGEYSCGINEHKKPKSHRCKCKQIRDAQIQKEQEKCDLESNGRDARIECYAKIKACHEIEIQDRDKTGGMPAQCQKYCTKSKCYCCNS